MTCPGIGAFVGQGGFAALLQNSTGWSFDNTRHDVAGFMSSLILPPRGHGQSGFLYGKNPNVHQPMNG